MLNFFGGRSKRKSKDRKQEADNPAPLENPTSSTEQMNDKKIKYDSRKDDRVKELKKISKWYTFTRNLSIALGIFLILFAVLFYDVDIRNLDSIVGNMFKHPILTRVLILLLGISLLLLSMVPLRSVYKFVNHQKVESELEHLILEDYSTRARFLGSEKLKDEKEIQLREYFLEKRRKELVKYTRWQRWARRLLSTLGIFSLIFAVFVFYLKINEADALGPILFEGNEDVTRALIVLFGFAMILLSTVPLRNAFQNEIQEIDHELNMLNIRNYPDEARSETLFRQHHLELKRYYDEALRENAGVYRVGVLSLLLGFLIIGVTFYLFYIGKFDTTESIVIAVLGGVSAIATDLVAAVYLKMHSETIKTLTLFHNRFVNTHHFYFSNFLISKIQHKVKKEDALIKLALKIIDDIEPESKEEQLKEEKPKEEKPKEEKPKEKKLKEEPK